MCVSCKGGESPSENLAVMKRVCILICDDSQAWKPLDFGDMYINLLENSLEKDNKHGSSSKAGLAKKCEFHKCCCAAGDPISDELIESFDCFIISGSRFNVRDGVAGKLEWFSPLCSLVKKVAGDHPQKRIFGCCFGHQIIAHSLGGKVDKNPHDDGEFILLAETLKWDEKALAETIKEKCCCEGSCSAILKQEVKVICSHGDSVLQRPPESTLLASSGSCENEVIIYGAHNNIMSCQGHPEFEYEYAIEQRIWPAVVEKNNRLSEPKIRAAQASFKDFDRSCGPDQLSYLIADFLQLHE